MKKRAGSILDLIGNTPLVPIRRLNPYKKVTILAKLESFNPGGSVKDRIAKFMIEQAEARGELTRDKIILEASSGNTGIGLAMVAAVKGYKCLIAMSESASLERRMIMKAYGAEIMLTPAVRSTDGAIEAVYKLALEEPDKYFCTDQFNNPDNWKTHYHTTAMEIWEQTGGEVDAVVASMGTTGTLMGLTRRLRELKPSIRMVGLEPPLGHKIQGLKNMMESYKPGIYDRHLPDDIVSCQDDEAYELARKLARDEGIFVGMSSGAAFSGALQVASTMEHGTVVVIFPDGGERYLSTPLFQVPDDLETPGPMVPRLTNSFGRRKEVFEPLKPEEVGIYSCGPTACERMGLQMARRLVVADVLVRMLEGLGYRCRHVMNITDVDDRTVAAAIAEGRPLRELTDRYVDAFFQDAKALRIRGADLYPRASDHIDDMIHLTQRLIEAGFAYERHGSVYFDISKLDGYGDLSRIDLEGIDVGRTVDLDEYEKDSPYDFTLFKRVTLEDLKHGIGWQTPWGKARPGWHIECAAMSMKYLGEFFDIHTSGINLAFPHHENEIAIARALTGNRLARFWLHSESVKEPEDGKVTVAQLLEKGFSGRQIRFCLLRSHYRKPVTVSEKTMKEAVKALKRLDLFVEDLVSCAPLHRDRPLQDDISDAMSSLKDAFMAACLDDLNIPKALGELFGAIRGLNGLMARGEIGATDARFILETLRDLDETTAIMELPGQDALDLPSEILELIEAREAARARRDWKEADEVRTRLLSAGYRVVDTKGGQRLKRIEAGETERTA